MQYAAFFEKKLLKINEIVLENCHDSICFLNDKQCDPYPNCSLDYQPLCANNLHNYSNECEMHTYACQSNINLAKSHDGTCTSYELQQLRQGTSLSLFLQVYQLSKLHNNEFSQFQLVKHLFV